MERRPTYKGKPVRVHAPSVLRPVTPTYGAATEVSVADPPPRGVSPGHSRPHANEDPLAEESRRWAFRRVRGVGRPSGGGCEAQAGGRVEPGSEGKARESTSFARGMVKRIYTDYPRERGIEMMTPATMDPARVISGWKKRRSVSSLTPFPS